MKSFTRVFLGLLLILTGTMCILKVVGLIDIDISLNGWWTFFIIIPCLNGFLTNHDKFGSLIGLIVGILLLLAAQDVFAYGIVLKLIVPIIIILLGFKLLKKILIPQIAKNVYTNRVTNIRRCFPRKT